MPENPLSSRSNSSDEPTPFDQLIAVSGHTPREAAFTSAFRGYDKDEVDAAIAGLTARVRAEAEQTTQLTERHRRVLAQGRQAVARLEAELETAKSESAERVQAEVDAAQAETRETLGRLEAELAAAQARAANAEQQTRGLTEELAGSADGTPSRHKFEEVLRVAEDQASVLLRNATDQGDRLLNAAREEIDNRRKEAKAEAEAIVSHAQHDAQQARLRIDTELTAHQARIERESAHAAEKVVQAEREAAAIRTEAEKGAAALRSMGARETELARADAEDAVRELRVRALEFEASLTRRQDDAQQEFLVLHNQAVAHAERITQDANEQVAASLEHAQRVASKAEDFERLMRAQAHQIEADANLRANEQLDRARVKAQQIMDMVTMHSQSVLRDAEDRTRQLRWQQQQLTSFMAEVSDLIRPETAFDASEAEPVEEAERIAEPAVSPEDGERGGESEADQADELERVEG
ncbi:DivIVA domain-containing protein [Microbacterium sp. cf046]|uniref:DivIVA domain-containing protein n=1 Tax=Microbacterium sp. cf046 TaxID=1761803 RepID=UPI0008E9E8E5|nr:DivIVA domain-containing protein [Microbacterium sp. cf046]SFR93987.1 DivIVA domain-containing protein [Microbacterium sp. cf046]